MHYRVFNSNPGVYTRCQWQSNSPNIGNQKYLQTLLNIPGREKSPHPVENHYHYREWRMCRNSLAAFVKQTAYPLRERIGFSLGWVDTNVCVCVKSYQGDSNVILGRKPPATESWYLLCFSLTAVLFFFFFFWQLITFQVLCLVLIPLISWSKYLALFWRTVVPKKVKTFLRVEVIHSAF